MMDCLWANNLRSSNDTGKDMWTYINPDYVSSCSHLFRYFAHTYRKKLTHPNLINIFISSNTFCQKDARAAIFSLSQERAKYRTENLNKAVWVQYIKKYANSIVVSRKYGSQKSACEYGIIYLVYCIFFQQTIGPKPKSALNWFDSKEPKYLF